MIKKILITLLSCFCFLSPATANLSLQADALDRAIRTYFPDQTNASAALVAYTEFVRNGDGVSIAAKDLWAVCSAGGLDIKKPEPKKTCQSFVNNLVKNATIKYFEVCGSDKGKSGGTEVCVDAFKNTRLNLTPAIEMAKEYVSVKYNDTGLICSSKMRTGYVGVFDKDDFLKCTSTNSNTYYEFEFGTAEAWSDNVIQNNVRYGVCDIIYGVSSGSRTDSCEANEAMCKKINKSVKRFGYSAYQKDNRCYINFETVRDAKDLRTAYDIDNFVFCRGIQVSNTPDAEAALKRHVVVSAAKKGEQINDYDVVCDAGFKTYKGKGCKADFWQTDDIKTCSINGHYIDYVFDDVNEAWKSYHKGGVSGMECINSDGSFDGRNCRLLGEENCRQLADVLKESCPECDQPVWNGTTCNLPSAEHAAKIQNSIKIVTQVGVAAVGVALFFIPGAQGGAILALNYVAGGLVIAGAAGRVASNLVMQNGIYKDFADAAETCNNETCAKELLNTWLQKIQSYKKEFTDAEQMTVDELCTYLFDKIPADSDFWLAFMQNSELFDPVTCEIKTKKQFWQKVRTVSEIAEIAGSLLRIGNLAFQKTTEKVTQKIGEKTMAFGKGGNQHGSWIKVYQINNTSQATAGVSRTLTKNAAKYGTQLSAEVEKNVLRELGLTKEMLKGARFTAGRKSLKLADGRLIDAVFKMPITTVKNVSHVTLNLRGLVNPAWGTLAETGGETMYFESKSGSGYKVPLCLKQEGPFDPSVEIIDIEEVEEESGSGTGGGTGSTIPGGGDDDTGDGDNPGGGDETVPPEGGTGPVNTVDDNIMYKTIKGKKLIAPENNKNKGLVAALVATGVVATGALIGGIVVSTSKDKSGNDNNVANKAIETDTDLQLITNNIRSGFGYVNNNQISLVPLPTSVGSSAPIVVIDGYAVVVVSYAGYRLPFYMNGTTWAPVLGIGETGHWFNVYPAVNEIKKMDTIAGILNEKLPPFSVAKYTNNMGGVSFPVADQKAFAIINAEFPNGVVQSVNMTPADQQLYSNNYYLMKSKIQ